LAIDVSCGRRVKLAILYENYESDLELLLGSLFHDIGKFAMRSKDEVLRARVNKEYEAFFKEDGYYSSRHQEWGAYFCKEFIKIPEVENIVLRHHNPMTKIDYIVAIADRLSAGERVKNIDGDNLQLMSVVLSTVSLENRHQKNKKVTVNSCYRPISKLSEYKRPVGLHDGVDEEYKQLWNCFTHDFKRIVPIQHKQHLVKMYYLLEEYLSNIPSAYFHSVPDVSLWAHAKTTAAIAFALIRQYENKDLDFFEKIYRNLSHESCGLEEESPFCLVKGDISGIQNFVYDIDMDNAAKALRGRSFYISYLLKTVATRMLIDEKLPLTNLLYEGGGHFYLLMPGYFLHKLEDYRTRLNELMYEAHGQKLSILLAGESVSFSDLQKANFSTKWSNVSKSIIEEKNRKFLSLIKKEKEAFFGPFDTPDKVCPYCKGPLKHDDSCDFCDSFVELGEKIVKSKVMAESWHPPEKRRIKRVEDVFANLGLKMKLENEPLKGFINYSLDKKDLDLNKYDDVLKIPTSIPMEKGAIKSFDSIANASQGLKRWGILRGDVDNLGSIFKSGLGDRGTISRVMNLSGDIAHFFGPILEELVTEDADCMVIYSGGDDFFIVGRWDRLPYIANRIHEEFRNYCGFNPDVTVSMAINVAPDVKFPLYKVAKKTGDDLDSKAKSLKRANGLEKDAVCVFGIPIGWEEFPNAENIKSLLTDALNQGVSRSLLNIIYSTKSLDEEAKENDSLFKSWRAIYALTRLKERHGKQRDVISQISDSILLEGNKLYPHTMLCARWAEFETRNSG